MSQRLSKDSFYNIECIAFVLCLVGNKRPIYPIFHFLQNEIRRIGEDLLKLGILHGTSNDEASVDEQPEMMTFANKLFHEYWAAYYASRRLSNVTSKVNFIPT